MNFYLLALLQGAAQNSNIWEILPLGWVGTAITTVISAWATWYFTRRKFKAEAQGSELQNVDKAIGIWKRMAKDLEEQVGNMKKEIDTLREELQEKNELERHLRNEIINLRGEVQEFKQKVNELRVENNDLRKELQNWRTDNSRTNGGVN